MLWPVVLPFKITFWGLAALVILATIVSASRRRIPTSTFFIASAFALIAFVPSCIGVQSIVDARRFGVFQHASFEEVQDFRVERFLPKKAYAITLEKKFIGHRAKYSISEADLIAYLDQLWETYGKYSAIPRTDLEDGTTANEEEFGYHFGDLGWPPPNNAVQYHSPVEHDGGGATYYFDATSNTAYHRAVYW